MAYTAALIFVLTIRVGSTVNGAELLMISGWIL